MSNTKQRAGITQRGGVWGYRFTYRDNGVRRVVTAQSPTWNRADAIRERDKARAQVAAGLRSAPSSLTVADYLTDWLDVYARSGRRKPSTITATRNIVTLYVVPRLGAMTLTTLKRAHVERFYADLLEGGRIGEPGGLAPKTIRNVAGVLHKALDDAVRRSILATNPADRIELPRWERPDLHVWDSAQVGQFLHHCATVGDPHLAVWRLILATGMRRGEICGLRWQDVDLVDGTVTIAQTRVRGTDTFIVSTPKTRAGRRTVAIDAQTVTELARLRNTLDAVAERYSVAPFAMVATDLDGMPVHPLTLTRRFQRLARAAGLPVIRLHDARHTAATQQLGARVPIHVVSGRLGHANASTTLSVYAHYLPSADRDASSVVGSVLDDAIRASRLRPKRPECVPNERNGTHDDDTGQTTKPNKHNENDTTRTSALEATPGIEPPRKRRKHK